jgi:guanidinoacetate N-methyltransferase
MTRKIKRSHNFELILNIGNDEFVAPPRASQRNWILNRIMSEWSAELNHLDETSRKLVAGKIREDEASMSRDWTQASLQDQQIMEDWQVPVMEAMAQVAAGDAENVLEIGFGRGISASYIQKIGVSSHTIIECNDEIVTRFLAWQKNYPGKNIRLLHGRWQDLLGQFEDYDAVFFHAYPLTEDEFMDEVIHTTTFAESFFPVAAAHLKDGGVFTYLANESDSISRAHQRLLLSHFRCFVTETVGPLAVPEDTGDSLWGNSMIIIKAYK